MATPINRVELTLPKKVELLQCLSRGATSKSVVKKFGVSKSQVYRLVKSKDRIFALYELGLGGQRKRDMRRRTCKEQVVSQALHVWYLQKVARGERLSGPMVKAKATELAAAKGRDFIPSGGWLERWKLRHDISFRKGHSEKHQTESMNSNSCSLEKDEMMEILSRYSPSNIFSACGTALYFRGYPENGRCRKGSELPGGKRANERITVMLCTNIDGTEKLPLLAIGETKKSKLFPKDGGRLPVSYTTATNAWMTRDIFQEWLQQWDLELRDANRHICLFVYDFPSHNTQDIQLTNITLKLLPQNKPSVLWPMEVGVTKIWKAQYRSRLCCRVNAALDADECKHALDVAGSLTLLDALYLIKDSWSAVATENILACFAKAGFIKSEPDDDTLACLGNIFTNIIIPENMTLQEFDEFISLDDDLEIEGELSDLDLLSVAKKSLDLLDGNEHVSDDSDSAEEKGILTSEHKIKMLDHLRRFVQENAMNHLLPFVKEIEDKVYSQVHVSDTQENVN